MMMIAKRSWRGLAAASLALVVALATPWAASADEADARKLLKAMSVYLAAQKTMAFSYDADLEVVTKDGQRLTLASSGTLALARPDKLRATRAAGFADIELVFDGKTATLLAKTGNVYARVDEPGSVDRLIDVLRDKYGMLLPAADLLLPDPYALLMADVVDVKDLGSGVVGGTECDHLAFRAKEVDWQIWIAHGPRPYPCKYVITSKQVAGGPQYSVQVRDWKAGSDVPASDFGFKPPAGSREVAFKDLPGASDLPAHFSK